MSVPVWGFTLGEVVPEPGVERELRARQAEKEAGVGWQVVLKLFGPRTLCRIINYCGPQRAFAMWAIAIVTVLDIKTEKL